MTKSNDLQNYFKNKLVQQIGEENLNSTKGIFIDAQSDSSKDLAKVLVKESGFLSLIIGLNVPTFIMAIMKLIIEKQKSEKNIKILRKIKRILNVLSIIYLTLYEIFLLFIILFVKLWKLEPGGLLGE